MNIFKNTLLLGLLMLIRGAGMSQENLPTPYVVSNFKVTVTTVGSNQQVVYSDFNLPSNLQSTMLLTYRIAGSGSAWSIFSPTYGDQPEIRTLPLGNTYEFGLQIYFTDGSPTQVITPTTPLAPGKYVRSWDANAPEQSTNVLPLRLLRDVKQVTTYVDGFGRPIQTVSKQGSFDPATSSFSDFVSAVVYDDRGREKLKYLPFPANNTGGNTSINDGLLKSNPFQQQASFYNNQLAGQTGETLVGPNQLNWAYGKTDFEASPLNRVNKSMSPGSSWVGSTRGTQTKYWTNTTTDDVKIWNITAPVAGPAELTVSIVNNGNGTQTVTYNWPASLSAGTTTSFIDYRSLPNGSWNSITNNPGTSVAPRTYTMPVGTYEYSVVFWKNSAYTQRYLNTGTPSSFNSYTVAGVYPAGALYKNVIVDPQGMQLIEFKDKNGKLILKKMQLGTTAGIADDGTGRNYDGWLCTYYIYDDLENLRCVIQPEGVKSLNGGGWTTTTTILDEQCFRYEYDERGHLIIKKVPGVGEVSMVYDIRDRMVLMQDANLRNGTPQKWMYTLYDELNRPTSTGLWENTQDRTYHQGQAATSASYPNLSGQTYDVLTRTFYDDYSWVSTYGYLISGSRNASFDSYLLTSPSSWPYPQSSVQSLQVKGLVTGTWTKLLESASGFSAVNIYDDKGRIIQTQANNISGGLDIVTMQYSWFGQSLITISKTERAGGSGAETTVIVTQNSYDDLGRLTKVEKKQRNTSVTVNGVLNGMSNYATISTVEYDQLGQLKKKTIGSKKDFATNAYITPRQPLQELTYDYNIRGWMLGMNRDYLVTEGQTSDGKYFGFELGYDKLTNKAARNFTGIGEFNGNIGGMIWKSDGDDIRRKYDFRYDPANRFLKADFEQQNSNDHAWNNSQVNYNVKMGDGITATTAYDANGNIKRMQQWGLKLTSSTQIDDLTYNYMTNSNKLLNVADAFNDNQTKLGDFRVSALNPVQTKTTTTVDYTYDVNGNMVKDMNKDLGNSASNGIVYNHLNLPQIITVYKAAGAIKGTITYTYDAAGNKLKKAVLEYNVSVPYGGTNYTSNITTTTLYLGGLAFESKDYVHLSLTPLDYIDKLQFAGHEEGRMRALYNSAATPNTITGFAYDYFVKDHLGNVRMVLTDEQKQDIYPATTLENVTYNGGTAVSVESQYYTIDNTKIVAQSAATGITAYQNNNGNPPYNNNPYSNTTANSARLYQLNANTNKTGLGIVLKVMARDVINIYGKSYHKMPTGGYTNPITAITVAEIINAFAGTGLVTSKGVTGTQTTGTPGFPTTVTALLGSQPGQTSSLPKAYINWIIFDEQFKYVSGGFDMVGGTGVVKSHSISTIPSITIPKNGYIYVYCSNESKYNVFFDNLQVFHTRGPILEETHYYPFGLTMSGISSKALNSAPENKRKWNAGTELNTDFDINLYETFYRSLDPQIGRFWQIDPKPNVMESPYASMGNNPISCNDPLGDTLRGSSRQDARRIHRIIRQTFRGRAMREVRRLFQRNIFKGDNNTFASISQGRLSNATAKLSPDQRALAEGYVDAINSTQVHTVEAVRRGERLKDANSTQFGDRTGADIDASAGGGFNVLTANGTHSAIVMNSTAQIPDYRDNTTGNNVAGMTSSKGELLAHELLGHGLTNFNPGGSQFLNAIQLTNLYHRATGTGQFYRDGTSHGGTTGVPLSFAQASGIPTYLQQTNLIVVIQTLLRIWP